MSLYKKYKPPFCKYFCVPVTSLATVSLNMQISTAYLLIFIPNIGTAWGCVKFHTKWRKLLTDSDSLRFKVWWCTVHRLIYRVQYVNHTVKQKQETNSKQSSFLCTSLSLCINVKQCHSISMKNIRYVYWYSIW